MEKIYVKGLRTFKPNEKAPDFVKGTLIISPNELIEFLRENEKLMTDYKGTKQLRCQILDGNNGLYFTVDTFKPESKPQTTGADEPNDLPF